MLNNQKGFTLLELLVSITLLAILLIPLSNLFLLSFQTTGATKVQLSDRTIAIDILEELKEAVRSKEVDSSFTYEEEKFTICCEFCEEEELATRSEFCKKDVSFKVNNETYLVHYTIINFNSNLNEKGISIPPANTVYKIELTLIPPYKPQGSEDIEYTVLIARKNG